MAFEVATLFETMDGICEDMKEFILIAMIVKVEMSDIEENSFKNTTFDAIMAWLNALL